MIGIVASALPLSAALADDAEIALRGLVDCGSKSEKACKLNGSFFFDSAGLGEGTQHIKVDLAWIKPDRIPSIDQDDELCLTGFIREDGIYQATSLNEQCDEGTVNDKSVDHDKKEERKNRDR